MEIKDAAQRAIEFAKDSLGPERTSTIRLEEIESTMVAGNPVWQITLSNATLPAGPTAAIREFAIALGADAAREYTVFTVSKYIGEVVSMKIRVLAAPAA